MLINIVFSNFYSFGDEAALSMGLTKRDPVHGWDRTLPSGHRLTTAMAVLGANGSGKTSLVKALAFLANFTAESFQAAPDSDIPFFPHFANLDRRTTFSVETEDEDGVRWFYSLTLARKRVVFESLRRKAATSRSRLAVVFERDWLESDQAYVVNHPGVDIAPSEAGKVRQNVSFISWARQYGAKVPDLFNCTTNLGRLGRDTSSMKGMREAAAHFQAAPEARARMEKLLLGLDLGLDGIEFREIPEGEPGPDQKKYWWPFGRHDAGGKKFVLPFGFESSGTQTALSLLRYLFVALESGGLALIDEFDSDLHPMMVEPILRLFSDHQTNPRGAQLIFSVQSPDVLKLLKPPQVTFVEKVDCISTSYRGDEIRGLKATDNFYGKYMAGALGAIPQL